MNANLLHLLSLSASIAALAFSSAAFLDAGRSSAGAAGASAPEGARSTSPELPGVEVACGESSVEDLQELMRARVNPTMTNISYALFHSPATDRLSVVAREAARMLGCVGLAPGHPPRVPLSRLAEYYDLVDDTQSSALALHTAALEGDDEQARHWFSHLKQSCVACHTRFRGSGEE